MKHQIVAALIIGNEILSGRTHEKNAGYIAQRMFSCGCRLGEIAVVPDHAATIIHTLHRLCATFDAVITSGGIGPTHDDITMQAVADACGVPLKEDADIIRQMSEYYGDSSFMNDGRCRMARMPEGASPIICALTIAPGAHIKNIYVLAGVPDIFIAQLEAILDDFGDQPFIRRELDTTLPESLFSLPLEMIQNQFPQVEIGSYPGRCDKQPEGKICLSSQCQTSLDQAFDAVKIMLEQCQSVTTQHPR